MLSQYDAGGIKPVTLRNLCLVSDRIYSVCLFPLLILPYILLLYIIAMNNIICESCESS